MATLELGNDGSVTLRLPDSNGRVTARTLRRPTVREYRDRLEALHEAVSPIDAARLDADAESRRLFAAAAEEGLDDAERTSRLVAARDHSRRAGADVDRASDDATAGWLAGTVELLAPKGTLADPDTWPIDALNGAVPTRMVEHWRSTPFDYTATPAKAAKS